MDLQLVSNIHFKSKPKFVAAFLHQPTFSGLRWSSGSRKHHIGVDRDSAMYFLNRDVFNRDSVIATVQGKRRPNLVVLGERKNEKKRSSFSRAGGRSRKRRRTKSDINKADRRDTSASSIFSTIAGMVKRAFPLLILLTLMKGLLSFLFSGMNSNVVYYSRTVYESTSYDENGEIERFRKENVRSNVPSMISDKNLLRGSNRARSYVGDEGLYYSNALDDELRSLDEEVEVESIYRSTISDDFF